MSALAYPVATLMERLAGIEGVAAVEIAPDTDALETPPRRVPTIYVTTETRGAPLSYSGNPIQQSRTTLVSLFVWVAHHGQRAALLREAMDAVLAAIDARLAGWIPGDGFCGPVFSTSRDVFAQGPHLVTQVTYECMWDFLAEVQP